MRAFTRVSLIFAVGTACGGGASEPARVELAPSIVMPRDLLDSVTKITLTVYDASSGLDCDAATGKLTQPGAKSIAGVELATTLPGGVPCPSSGKFCGTVTIPKSDTPRIFQAQAATGSSGDFADGCAKAVANEDTPLPVKIVMVRNVPPSVCGDGVVGATEQCEPPDPTCDSSCHTTELLLSNGAGETSTGAPGDKTNPFFLWPSASGDGGRLLAFFGDTTVTSIATSNNSRGALDMRAMSDAFAPLASAPAATYLPTDPTQFPAQPPPGKQQLPAAAVIGTQYFVVFDDDASGTRDIHLRSMDASLTAQQPFTSPIGINGTSPNGGGELGTQTAPAVSAGPSSALFIAWQDDGAQKIAGRTFAPSGSTGTLGPQQDISSGTGNANVQIAATSSGWICVWDGGGDIKMRSIDPTGRPFGSETVVNENTAGLQDHATIAALADGRFVVAWSDHTPGGATIVAQRFTASAAKVAGDQASPISTLSGSDQISPRAAAMNAVGGSFVVTWLDAPSSHVRARLLGGSSGFLFNNVDGQSGDFRVSIADGRPRQNPVVVVGGSGPYIAFGWEDRGSSAPYGVVGRRFPLPAQ